MLNYINSSISFIQNHSVPMKELFEGNFAKYAKIAAIAIVAFGALSTIYLVVRHYHSQIKKNGSPKLDIPKKIFPKPPQGKNPSQNPLDKREINEKDKKNKIEIDKKEKKEKEAEDLNEISSPESSIDSSPSEESSPEETSSDETSSDETSSDEYSSTDEFSKNEIPLVGSKLPSIVNQTIKINLEEPIDQSPSLAGKKQPIVAEPVKLNVLQSSFSQVENICNGITENIFINASFSAQKAFAALNPKTLEQTRDLLDELVEEFEGRYPSIQKIKYGYHVPEYFAQVKDLKQDEERKYLSLVGIRNMLKYGPGIIDDFRTTKFLGGAHHYNDGKGLKAFKFYTGTVIDLDTEIEAENDFQAIIEAKKMIVNFGKICGLKSNNKELTAEQVANQLPYRKLNIPPGPIYMSQSHTDRSNYGIWKRQAPKGNAIHYYVNVPNCDIVLLGTLRFPYLIAEVAQKAKDHNGGKLPTDFLDAFFKDGLSDMCFNDKVRTFMNFYLEWMAKYEGALLSPEEEAKKRIESGSYGEALKNKGAQTALKEAFTRDKLINLFETLRYDPNADTPDALDPYADEKIQRFDFSPKGRTYEKWVHDEFDVLTGILIQQDVWDSTLYCSEKGQDYFLLNGSTLKTFMKEYYTKYLIYM